MTEVLPSKPTPPLPGHYGNLNAEQNAKLAEIWELFFSVIDNPEQAQQGQIGTAAGHDDDQLHGLSKDDKAKAIKAQHEEQAALKGLFKEHGVEEFYNQFWFLCGPDVPDMAMLKFLRARKSDVVDHIRLGDEGLGKVDSKYPLQGQANKVYVGGMTDNQLPIVYIHAARHLTKAQSADTMTRFVISSAESFRSLVAYPNDKIVIVFNLGGFGMKNMDWHTLTTILKILEGFYPETLTKLYVHNAPWIFQGIWKALSPMLDPAVREKICFSNKPSDLDLVPMSRLPASLGGDLSETPEYVPPTPNENTSRPVGDPERKKAWGHFLSCAKQYEKTTRDWDKSKGSDDKLWSQRDYEAKKLRLAWLDMEPLIRGKTNYHRLGIITPDYTLNWTYKQKNGQVLKQEAGQSRGRSALRKAIAEREGATDSLRDQSQTQPINDSSNVNQSSSLHFNANEEVGWGAGMAGVGVAGAGAAAATASGHHCEANQKDYDQGFSQRSEQSGYPQQDYGHYQQDPGNAYAFSAYDNGVYDNTAYDTGAYNNSNAYYQGYDPSYTQGYEQGGYQVGYGQEQQGYSHYANDAALGVGAGATYGQYNMPAQNSLSYLQTYSSGTDPYSAPFAQAAPQQQRRSVGGSETAESIYTNASMGQDSTEDLFYDTQGTPMEGTASDAGEHETRGVQDLQGKQGMEEAEEDEATKGKAYQPQPHSSSSGDRGAAGYDLTHGQDVQLEDGVEGGVQKGEKGGHKDFDEQIAEAGMTETGAKIGKEKSPLAGFPHLASGGGTEEIAEANRRAREAAEQAKNKPSLWSKLNCCGGKNVD